MKVEPGEFQYDAKPFAGEIEAGLKNTHIGSRLLFENDRIRVWDITLKPGDRVPFHRHYGTYFYRCQSAGMVRVRRADGTGGVYETAPDQVSFHPISDGDEVMHDLENVGETTVCYTTVELL